MDYSKTLKQIDDVLSAPQVVAMTEAQFEAYVADQIEKGKKEKDEKDGYEKSKKRLDHLRKTIETVSKTMWEGTNGTQAIPTFEEPNLTVNSEKTEKEVPLQNMQTQGAQAWSGEGGATGFNKAVEDLAKSIDGLAPKAPTGTPNAEPPAGAAAAPAYNWPSDIANPEFLKEGVNKNAPAWGKDTE